MVQKARLSYSLFSNLLINVIFSLFHFFPPFSPEDARLVGLGPNSDGLLLM